MKTKHKVAKKPLAHRPVQKMLPKTTHSVAKGHSISTGHMTVRVKSSNPVIVDRRPYANQDYLYGFQNDGFVNFDSTDSSLTTQFQEWYNVNRKATDPAVLSVDGFFGPLTSAAYGTDTGKAFDATLSPPKAAPTSKPSTPPTSSTPTPSQSKTPDVGMSAAQKIGIVAGGAFVVIIAIMIFEGKHKSKTAVAAL